MVYPARRTLVSRIKQKHIFWTKFSDVSEKDTLYISDSSHCNISISVCFTKIEYRVFMEFLRIFLKNS